MNTDSVIYFGGAVKALDDSGRVGGYLVRFTDPTTKDLQDEYFDEHTYFGARDGDGCDTLFHHGRSVGKGLEALADHVFQPLKAKKDSLGIWAETVLNQADEYESLVYKLVKAGKIGWSSGSSPHLTKKSADGRIERWIISEGSLTHMPVDPLARALPLKSLEGFDANLLEDIKSVETPPVDLAGLPAIGQYCKDVSPNSNASTSQISESAASAHRELFTIINILGEANHSNVSRLVRRSENRFLKDGREIDVFTAMGAESLLTDMDKITPAVESIKEPLEGIRKLCEMSKAQQKAMDEKARFALWNYHRISGTLPEEFENAGTSTGEHI